MPPVNYPVLDELSCRFARGDIIVHIAQGHLLGLRVCASVQTLCGSPRIGIRRIIEIDVLLI